MIAVLVLASSSVVGLAMKLKRKKNKEHSLSILKLKSGRKKLFNDGNEIQFETLARAAPLTGYFNIFCNEAH